VFSSAAGHGVHCTIEDALNLGSKLGLSISGAASPLLLQTYDTERHGHQCDRAHAIGPTSPKVARRSQESVVGIALCRRQASALDSAFASKQADKLVTDYGESSLSRQDSSQMTPRTRAGMLRADSAVAKPTFRDHPWPQADILLFAGLSPMPETMKALRAIEETVASLGEHLRVVFTSQAYASDAGMSEDDPKVRTGEASHHARNSRR
jgi:FAD binding domain